MANDLRLRPAGPKDRDLILAWRNDSEARANSFSGDHITPEAHEAWYAKRLADPACRLFILTEGETPVGHIRIDLVKDAGEISYLIAPEARGKGYGKAILSLLEQEVPEGLHTLMGMVKGENEASRKCFAANDYAEFFGGGICVFLKHLS